MRHGVDQPRALLSALIAKGQRQKQIQRGLNPDATARLMIAAFHGFILQKEWDRRVKIEPYLEVLDLCLQRLFAAD